MVVRGDARLERVAIAGRDEHPPSPLFLTCGCGRKKIVGLVACAARVGEAARADEFGNYRELFVDVDVEFAPALIGREGFVPVGFLLQRVPGDDDGARRLVGIELQQQIGEAQNGAGRPVALPPDRLRQRVIGAVGEGIAVDGEEWFGRRRLARRFRFRRHYSFVPGHDAQ